MAGLAALADFGTKQVVRERMAEGSSVSLAPFFNLVSARNHGAAFSMLADAGGWQRHALAAFALAVTAALAWMLTWQRSRLEAASFSLIMGGAVGNAIDRIHFGAVTDFLDFHWAGWHWPAFNVADIAICVGAALLVTSSLSSARSGG
ncbi:signal peptidase II [Ramlibacter sp. AN1015]|uniref:signal peptidase II n=1 Tax=Ramlibacter sp. AN1015 TaxID=3133428 RepID=UPI0030C4C12D